jgi:hypothetical protein
MSQRWLKQHVFRQWNDEMGRRAKNALLYPPESVRAFRQMCESGLCRTFLIQGNLYTFKGFDVRKPMKRGVFTSPEGTEHLFEFARVVRNHAGR